MKPTIKSPPRILTEPLARLLASELGYDYDALPDTTDKHCVVSLEHMDRRTLRAITRKLIWSYTASSKQPTTPPSPKPRRLTPAQHIEDIAVRFEPTLKSLSKR